MKAYSGDDPFIFVSYSRSDRDLVSSIIDHLQNNGYRVWFDEGLHAGNDWRDELAERVKNCRVFLYMCSVESIKSEYCKAEIYWADSEAKRRISESDTEFDPMEMITIQLETANISGGLGMILAPKQMISAIDMPASEVVEQLINSGKLEDCRDAFRYVEGVNWGPARDGFFFGEAPPDQITMNSLIDNPLYGDERHFLAINGNSQKPEDHLVQVQPGSVYTAEIYVCNDANPELNKTGKTIADNIKVAVDLPKALKAGSPEILQAEIWWRDQGPEWYRVWDQIALVCPADAIIEYVSATSKIYTFGKLNGEGLGTVLFSEGVYIGFNKRSGMLPGGIEYSCRIEFQFIVKPIRKVSFQRTVSVDRRTFADRIAVVPGDILTFRITMHNDHYDDIEDVTFRDELPKELELIPDTTILYSIPEQDHTSSYVYGRKLCDAIALNGINTGLYGPDIPGVIQYKARVREDITETCELITKSFLYYRPMKRDENNPLEKIKGEQVTLCSEATCYVHKET